ncbi:MAG TPA: hypothetical protein DHW07_05315, partial [Gammaproteobacteria bacterium]|nr:hypothetical protein [Gammaproteobacteria bacterium]
ATGFGRTDTAVAVGDELYAGLGAGHQRRDGLLLRHCVSTPWSLMTMVLVPQNRDLANRHPRNLVAIRYFLGSLK